MSKTFRAWKIDEPLFLPPTVQDFVAEDHLARFVLSLVRDDLDLIEISGKKAGLVKLGHVALDGTKIKANASKHKAMSYERMEKRAAELEAEVGKWLSAAEAADVEEDKLHGRDKTGDEMPEWVADKKRRAATIRKAKAELEEEAKAAAEAKLKAEAEAQEKREAEGRRKPGPKAAPPSTEPDAKAQKNSPIPTAAS